MRQPIYQAIFLLFAVPVSAQVPDHTRSQTGFIFSRNHLSISIMGGFAMKAGVSANPHKYDLGSSKQIASGGGINYHTNFSPQLSLIIGLHMAAPIRNIEYYIPKDEFDPALAYDLFHNRGISQEVVFLLRIPVTLEARRFYRNNKLWYISGGASLNYTSLQEEIEQHWVVNTNGQLVNYFNMLLQPNNNNKPWLNYHVGGGHGWILFNKNIISAGLIANLSFTNFIKGPFTVEVPGQPVITGNYSFKGSYLGFTVSYIYTGAKKRLKRITPTFTSEKPI